jgi:hypothetical protein
MTTKEIQDQIVTNMKRWQKIENSAVASTGQVIEKTENPILRMIMEIIQQDSQMHYRVQALIAESLTGRTISLTPDELGNVWDLVEHHIELERETVKLAKSGLAALKGKKMLVQEYLLNYLLIDEEKHNSILDNMSKIKSGMYPYA